MSKTRVTLTKIEPNQTIVKQKNAGTYQATKLTFTIKGVEETKNIMNSQLTHPNGAQVNNALNTLITLPLPVDVVLDEVQNGTFLNIVQILPKETPEESPRDAKPAYVPGGFNKSGGGFSGGKGYSKTDIAGMRRSVALQAAANAFVGRTSQEIVDAARVFEKFLNELDATATTAGIPVTSVGSATLELPSSAVGTVSNGQAVAQLVF